MYEQLTRLRALIGDEKLERLRNATVMVVGCGAVGSVAIEALARCGVGNMILIDFDTIELSNINRQLFAVHSTLGRKKVTVAQERIADINPEIKVTALDVFFDENTRLALRPDFVIDAIDTVQSKLALYNWCHKNDVRFVSSMGAARKTDPSKVKVAKISKTFACPLAARIRKLVRNTELPDFPVVFSSETPASHTSIEKNFGSIITVTGVFGFFLANYVLAQLLKAE